MGLFRRSHLSEIESLDPERDHLRIVRLNTYHEFPWDMARALEMALFRTFAVPSISGLLEHTGEFIHRPQRRYDDTDLILTEILEAGYDDPRGAAAIQRLNRLHGRWNIRNEDFIYVLSTFILEPIRWMHRFAWRPMSPNGEQAQYHYWQQVGLRMGIERIPESLAAVEAYNRDYEARCFHYAASNAAVCRSVRRMLLGWFLPARLDPLGEPFIHALLEPELLDAVGFPEPGPRIRRLTELSLRGRSSLLHLLPERRRPRLRTQIKRHSYPEGYALEALGPPDVPPDEPAEG